MKILLIILVIGTIFFSYTTYVSSVKIKVREYRITEKKIPASFNGLKIIQLTDLHYGTTMFNENVKDIVKMTNDRKPDLIVFTGDLINKNYKSIGDNKCLLITTLIFGNHDDDVTLLQVHDNCKVEDDKIILYPSAKDVKPTILKKIDNYYFWKSESSSLKVYVVGLDYDESMEFLSQISNDTPKKININDYYSESPDRECEFKFYDSGTQKYKHYEKKDIDKLIDDLNK